jgi:uncharacterized protein YndB with AHSA1/START domain
MKAPQQEERDMPVLKLTQVIRRPLEEVFDAVVDVAHFPDWNPTTRSARRLGDGAVGEGSRFELEIAGFGKTVQELQEFQRNHQVKLVPTSMKQMRGGHRFLFSRDASGTRIDHELEMFPKGLFVLMAPLMGIMGRRNLRATADALQRYVESRS